jgi:hypothetical protein|tara:strand:- start:446 stop:796 length:351 start_codon:yes stop_codon:yes gene_type:complete
MKITTKQNDNYLEVTLNGNYVGMSASCTDKILSIETAGHKDCKLVGVTATNKTFELSGGIHAGGTRKDWFLEVDGITVLYTNSAKDCLELLCALDWTDEQIDFSNRLYKKDTARKG